MTAPLDRPAPRPAGPELFVLEKWEEAVAWLLGHTARWPKHVRFTLAQRLEGHALDVLEMLAQARYLPAERARLLKEANLRFERMRLLFRIARGASVTSAAGFEGAMRRIDEAGRMVHGWRQAIGDAQPRRRDRQPAAAEAPA